MPGALIAFTAVAALILLLGLISMVVKCYRKVDQGQSLVRNGMGGTRVSFSGILVFPVVHKAELMDISVKRIEIYRHGKEGLICRDNMRADIKVAFFVRVNKTVDDVLRVAQAIGCARASSHQALEELFDAKFSEALKTVGRQFDFVDLYNSRDTFKEQILKIIGTDLNGFVLEDAAIDYLEQTSLQVLNADNILDAEGIKKITELTATQKVLANNIDREKEKTITQQNVSAREAILEMERALAEAEQKQKREVSAITSREEAEAAKIGSEQRQRSEQARIASEEEIGIAEENKLRTIIVARKNKERTEQVETERVEKDRMIEATERERIVALASIERDKAIEIEQKKIQEVIKERVVVERAVVQEKENIKNTEAFAEADRSKKVAVTKAEQDAEAALVREIKAAEAKRKAADMHAQELLVTAQAEQEAAQKNSSAKKLMAEALTAEEAALGLAEAQVLEAKAAATEKQGSADARVMELKFAAEAEGIEKKAAAMKIFDGVGREHEEFKLRLNKERDIDIATIHAQKEIAQGQAHVVSEALKSAKIDIIGGETAFFDKIMGAVTGGKMVDRAMQSSETLRDLADRFLGSDREESTEPKTNAGGAK